MLTPPIKYLSAASCTRVTELKNILLSYIGSGENIVDNIKNMGCKTFFNLVFNNIAPSCLCYAVWRKISGSTLEPVHSYLV